MDVIYVFADYVIIVYYRNDIFIRESVNSLNTISIQ